MNISRSKLRKIVNSVVHTNTLTESRNESIEVIGPFDGDNYQVVKPDGRYVVGYDILSVLLDGGPKAFYLVGSLDRNDTVAEMMAFSTLEKAINWAKSQL